MQKCVYNKCNMTIGLCYNTKVPLSAVGEIEGLLKKREAEVSVFSDFNEIEGVDRLLVLGGDGTVLRAAKKAAEKSIPLVGVNYGTVGFLTEFERDEGLQAVELVLRGETFSNRTMLDISLNGDHTFCLNECVLLHEVSKDVGPKLTKITAEIEGCGAGEFLSDGLIVSTPTGSTAYSLSAGGCILTPDCFSFLLTPVSAFSMRSRPVAYSDNRTLKISVQTSSNMLLYGDGKFLGSVGSKDELVVSRAERFVRFLTREISSYFGRLTSKLK